MHVSVFDMHILKSYSHAHFKREIYTTGIREMRGGGKSQRINVSGVTHKKEIGGDEVKLQVQ